MAKRLGGLFLVPTDELAETLIGLVDASRYEIVGRVEHSLEGLRPALNAHSWDMIVVDMSLPPVDGKSPVEFVEGRDLNGPVIYLADPGQEEQALATIEHVARYCVMKDDLDRFYPCIRRGLYEASLVYSRMRALEAAEDREKRYRSLVDNMPGIVYRCACDEHWTMEFISDNIERITGYPASDFIDNAVRSYASVIHPEDREEVERDVLGGVGKHEPFLLAYRLVHADGGIRWVTEKGRGVFDDDGELLWLDGFIFDDTERRRAEEALRQSEGRYAATIDALDQALHVVDRDLRLVFINKVFREWSRELGLEPDAVGCKVTDIYPFLPEQVVQEYRNVFETGETLVTEETTHLGERSIITETHKVPIIEDGEAVRVITIIKDITAEKQADDAFRESEARYRGLFEYSPVPLWEADLSKVKQAVDEITASGVDDLEAYFRDYPDDVVRCLSLLDVLDVNQEALHLHQAKSKQEFLGHFEDIFTERSMLDFARQLIAVGQGRTTYDIETSGITLRGEPRETVVRWAVLPGYEETFRRALVSIVDVTRLKEADKALRDSESRYRSLFEDAPSALWEEDRSEIKACLEDLKEAGVTDLAGYLEEHPETVEHCMSLIHVTAVNHAAVQLHGAQSEEELRSRLSDLFTPDALRAFRSQLIAMAEDRRVVEMEAVALALDGREIQVFVRWAVVPGHEERYDKTLTSVVDVSRLKRAQEEARQMQAQLFQVQKTEAIGRLAGGLAHDFNNLITVIVTAADAVLEAHAEGEALREDVHEIRMAAQRAATLTQQMLAFSRKQVLKPVRMDLSNLIANLEWMLRRITGPNVQLAVLYADFNVRIEADPNRLEQAILNVAVNAVDAMGDGGLLTLRTALIELDEETARRRGEIAPGRYVGLDIVDTGVGMDQETLSHALEPFFTTKEVGKGTGLGLPTAYGIVKQSGGDILIESQPGEGTTVRILLPVVTGEPQPARAPAPEAVPQVGREAVLVVEDEPVLRRRMVKVLRRRGFVVHQAPDSEQAVRLLDDPSMRVDLLLTDLVMPRMSGEELARRAVRERPSLRVLYVSGYAADVAFRDRPLEPYESFLQKPFTAEVLVNKVRERLSAPMRS